MNDKIESGIFNFDDVIRCDYQYKIRHQSTRDFKIGEYVYLKSNPEYPMIVHKITDKKIICLCENGELESFIPQCILQYRYSVLLVWKKKYDICIN